MWMTVFADDNQDTDAVLRTSGTSRDKRRVAEHVALNQLGSAHSSVMK